MRAKFLAVFVFAALVLNSASAQQFNKAKLDSLFDILASKDKGMGSVTLSKAGKVVYKRTIGDRLISPTEKIASNDSTEYRIGSISKMFTAVVAFQLIEEKKLAFETTIDKYFPELPNAKKITISNLLNHRSGLHNFTDDSAYIGYMTKPKTEAQMLDIIAKGGSDFEPDSKAKYSNSNFVVLGYIIEKICKQPLKQVVTERVIKKIGLKQTVYGGKTEIKDNECYSYREVNGWQQQPETDMSIPGGAGSIVASSGDLVKFIEALFNGKLVSKESLDRMKAITDGYGMGMIQVPFYTKKAYGHGGAIDGFNSLLFYFPDDSLAVAYCSNGGGYSLNNILIGVLSIYYNMTYTIPSFHTIALTTEDLDKYLGTYSSAQMPLKITVTKDNTTLMAQGTGQSAFPLEATDKDIFKFTSAGIEMDFDPDKKQFTLKQGGGSFLFTKD